VGGRGPGHPAQDTAEDTYHDASRDALLAAKDETIAALREQLAQVNERDRESRRTIAALTQRISELPSARPATSAAEWAEDEEARKEEVGMSIGSDEQRQSWWRKMFGG
jgi:septal ring factor EnvC (AmiA/AmiB activator)